MDLQLLSTPLTKEQKLEVVPVAELAKHLRIRDLDEDEAEVMEDDIEAAYDYLAGPEGWLGRCCLLDQEWEYFAPSGLAPRFELPMRPFSGATVTSFSSLQADGSYLDLEAGRFFVTPTTEAYPVIGRSSGLSWPYVGPFAPRAYRIRFKAGFGTSREAIPSGIRKSIRLLAGHWFKNREATGDAGRAVGQQIEFGLRSLAGRYRISPDHS